MRGAENYFPVLFPLDNFLHPGIIPSEILPRNILKPSSYSESHDDCKLGPYLSLVGDFAKEPCDMTTYEFYWEDKEGRPHFFGTLPERRDPKRITEESIMNWGKMLMGDSEKIKKIYFIKLED